MKELDKLYDDTDQYIHSNLTPRWTGLDVNKYVDNAEYIGWILERVPVFILEDQQISKMTLEYRRECEPSHVLLSLINLEKNSGDAVDLVSVPSYSCTAGSSDICNSL